MRRYPQTILTTHQEPWRAGGEIDEPIPEAYSLRTERYPRRPPSAAATGVTGP